MEMLTGFLKLLQDTFAAAVWELLQFLLKFLVVAEGWIHELQKAAQAFLLQIQGAVFHCRPVATK